jgi:hypothetical protein
VVENKPDPGESLGAEAIRERIAALEADCDRKRKALLSDLRRLSGLDYSRLPPNEAIWMFLKDNPGQQHIEYVTRTLVDLGAKLGGGKKGPLWAAKITVAQPTFAHIFQYDKKTGMVSLTPWAVEATVGTEPEGKTQRKRKRRSRPT